MWMSLPPPLSETEFAKLFYLHCGQDKENRRSILYLPYSPQICRKSWNYPTSLQVGEKGSGLEAKLDAAKTTEENRPQHGREKLLTITITGTDNASREEILQLEKCLRISQEGQIISACHAKI